MVTVTSRAGVYSGSYVPAYYATGKAGLVGYVLHLAASRPRGIRANAVAPGVIGTPRGQAYLASDQGRAMIDAIPMRRPGTPAEVASVICFLASQASSYVNGVTVAVDGGWTAAQRADPGRCRGGRDRPGAAASPPSTSIECPETHDWGS